MAFHRLVVAFAIAVACWLSAGVPAQAAATAWIGDQRAAVRLISATDGAGTQPVLDAGIEFRFGKGWHGYWRTPGDAGIAPQFDWSASENIARHDVSWPAPRRLVVEDTQNIVYQDSVVLPVKLFLKQAGAAARFDVSVNYGICSEVCVPCQAQLSLVLPTGSGAPSRESKLISSARKTVPGSAAAANIVITGARVAHEGSAQSLVLDLNSTGAAFVEPDLFIEGDGEGIPPAPRVTFDDDRRTAHFTVRLAQQPVSGRDWTATLIDRDRAAEFSVQAAGPATSGSAP
jgi:suppressor for copper-sensitivity B